MPDVNSVNKVNICYFNHLDTIMDKVVWAESNEEIIFFMKYVTVYFWTRVPSNGPSCSHIK